MPTSLETFAVVGMILVVSLLAMTMNSVGNYIVDNRGTFDATKPILVLLSFLVLLKQYLLLTKSQHVLARMPGGLVVFRLVLWVLDKGLGNFFRLVTKRVVVLVLRRCAAILELPAPHHICDTGDMRRELASWEVVFDGVSQSLKNSERDLLVERNEHYATKARVQELELELELQVTEMEHKRNRIRDLECEYSALEKKGRSNRDEVFELRAQRDAYYRDSADDAERNSRLEWLFASESKLTTSLREEIKFLKSRKGKSARAGIKTVGKTSVPVSSRRVVASAPLVGPLSRPPPSIPTPHQPVSSKTLDTGIKTKGDPALLVPVPQVVDLTSSPLHPAPVVSSPSSPSPSPAPVVVALPPTTPPATEIPSLPALPASVAAAPSLDVIPEEESTPTSAPPPPPGEVEQRSTTPVVETDVMETEALTSVEVIADVSMTEESATQGVVAEDEDVEMPSASRSVSSVFAVENNTTTTAAILFSPPLPEQQDEEMEDLEKDEEMEASIGFSEQDVGMDVDPEEVNSILPVASEAIQQPDLRSDFVDLHALPVTQTTTPMVFSFNGVPLATPSALVPLPAAVALAPSLPVAPTTAPLEFFFNGVRLAAPSVPVPAPAAAPAPSTSGPSLPVGARAPSGLIFGSLRQTAQPLSFTATSPSGPSTSGPSLPVGARAPSAFNFGSLQQNAQPIQFTAPAPAPVLARQLPLPTNPFSFSGFGVPVPAPAPPPPTSAFSSFSFGDSTQFSEKAKVGAKQEVEARSPSPPPRSPSLSLSPSPSPSSQPQPSQSTPPEQSEPAPPPGEGLPFGIEDQEWAAMDPWDRHTTLNG